jgi:hypothetical protein
MSIVLLRAGLGSEAYGERLEVAGDFFERANPLIVTPALEDGAWRAGIAWLIEEVVGERIIRAIRFAAPVLDHIDATQRLTHVVPVVGLLGVGYTPWRTRAGQERSPNTASMSSVRPIRLWLRPPRSVRRRAAFLHDTHRRAEDLTVRFRREVQRWQSRLTRIYLASRASQVAEGTTEMMKTTVAREVLNRRGSAVSAPQAERDMRPR